MARTLIACRFVSSRMRAPAFLLRVIPYFSSLSADLAWTCQCVPDPEPQTILKDDVFRVFGGDKIESLMDSWWPI